MKTDRIEWKRVNIFPQLYLLLLEFSMYIYIFFCINACYYDERGERKIKNAQEYAWI